MLSFLAFPHRFDALLRVHMKRPSRRLISLNARLLFLPSGLVAYVLPCNRQMKT